MQMSVGQNWGTPWTVGQGKKSISNEMPSMTSNWNQNTFNPSLALRAIPFLGKRTTETRIQLMLWWRTNTSTRAFTQRQGGSQRTTPFNANQNASLWTQCKRERIRLLFVCTPTPVRQGTKTTWGNEAWAWAHGFYFPFSFHNHYVVLPPTIKRTTWYMPARCSSHTFTYSHVRIVQYNTQTEKYLVWWSASKCESVHNWKNSISVFEFFQFNSLFFAWIYENCLHFSFAHSM